MTPEQLEKLRDYLRYWRDLSIKMKGLSKDKLLDFGFWEGKEDQAEETLVRINEILGNYDES